MGRDVGNVHGLILDTYAWRF